MKQLFQSPRRLGALALAVLAALLWALGMREKDVYNTTVTDPGYVSDYDPAADTAAGFAGQQVFDFELIDLRAGQYTLALDYTAAGAGSYVQLVDGENVTVLAEGSCEDGGGTLTLTFTLAQRLPRLAVRGYLGGSTLAMTACTVTSSGPVYTDAFWALALAAGLALAGWYFWRRWQAGHRAGLMLFAAALVLSLPLAGDALPDGHDLPFHLTRILSLSQSILHGQIPARLNETFLSGAGFLSSAMYPELFLYPAGAMCVAGASVLFAYKVLCLAVTLLTGGAAYAAARGPLGQRRALLFALVYLANPYRLNDLFLRAALGEALAMAFLPLAAAGIYELVAGDRRRGFWMGIVGITGVFQSHILSMLLLVLFGGGWAVCHVLGHARAFFGDVRRLVTLAGAAAATLALNLWFLLPFLSYSRWDLVLYHDSYTLDATAITPWQAFMDVAEYGGNYKGAITQNEMSFSVGLAAGLAALAFLWLAPRLSAGLRRAGSVCLGLGALALWMSTNQFPWARLLQIGAVAAVFNRLQFAWRFLIVTSLLWSLVLALVLDWLMDHRKETGAAVSLAVLAVLIVASAAVCAGSYLHSNPTLMESKSSPWDTNRSDNGQYLVYGHIASTVTYRARTGGVFSYSEGVTVTDYHKAGMDLDFSFAITDTSADTAFSLPLYSNGMHRAFLADGTELTAFTASDGMLYVTVPAGISAGTVQVRYYARRLFRAGDAVSLAAAAALGAGALWQRRRKNHKMANSA